MLLGRHQSSPRLLHRWWWRHNWLRIWNCMTSIQETLEIQTRKCNQHNMKLQRKKKRRTREKMCFDFSIRFSQPFFSDISISYDVISHKIRRQEEQEWHLKQTRRREGFWTRETNRDKTREWPSSLFKRKQAVVKEKRAGSGRTSMTMTTRGGKRRSAHKTWSVRKESKILWDNNNSISRLTLKSSERLNKRKKEWKKRRTRGSFCPFTNQKTEKLAGRRRWSRWIHKRNRGNIKQQSPFLALSVSSPCLLIPGLIMFFSLQPSL